MAEIGCLQAFKTYSVFFFIAHLQELLCPIKVLLFNKIAYYKRKCKQGHVKKNAYKKPRKVDCMGFLANLAECLVCFTQN